MLRTVSIVVLLVAILFGLHYAFIVSANQKEEVIIPSAITLLITSNTSSSFTPCGCSIPQGGMLRRGTAFSRIHEEVDWPVLNIDTGNVTQGSTVEIMMKKNDYIFQAYQVLAYDFVNVGHQDLRTGHDSLIGYRDLYDIPWSSCNLNIQNPDDSENTAENAFPDYKIIDLDGFQVALVGVTIQDMQVNTDQSGILIEGYETAIRETIAELSEMNVDLVIAATDAASFPEDVNIESVFEGADIVIATRVVTNHMPMPASPNATLNPANPAYYPADVADQDQEVPIDESESLFTPLPVPLVVPKASTQGKSMVRIDIWLDSDGKPFDYTFSNFTLNQSYEDDPRLAGIAHEYDIDVLVDELTGQVTRRSLGIDGCIECHPGYIEAWADHGHFNSYRTIEDAGSLDDRTCTECHANGYHRKPRLMTYEFIPETHWNVGCEGCHQNGTAHLNYINLLETWTPEQLAENQRSDPMVAPIQANLCAKCHSGEWGVGFDFTASIEAAREICQSVD